MPDRHGYARWISIGYAFRLPPPVAGSPPSIVVIVACCRRLVALGRCHRLVIVALSRRRRLTALVIEALSCHRRHRGPEEPPPPSPCEVTTPSRAAAPCRRLPAPPLRCLLLGSPLSLLIRAVIASLRRRRRHRD
uniref:Uncharacterized protein n=1 Tax=Oryza sativa subsp. japonica TaxID=39947 RepID=Q6ZF79_ORYSJ|nr:hypothetical protein [Oryza sativa Japonica Group]